MVDGSSTPSEPTTSGSKLQLYVSSDTVVPDADVERASGSTSLIPVDPFQFRDGIVTDEELSNLRRRKKGKAVAKYQTRQNNLIEALLKPMEEHTEDAKAEEEAARLPVKIAIYASLISNFALCVLQMYAAISSLSLSLLATGIDSVFDIGSNILLFWLHRKAVSLDGNKWPVGGARLETIGNIVYESIRTLITKEGDELAPFHLPSIISVSSALAVKFLLFLYSFSIRKKSSQVQVLWQDHRNDLWINGFGILMSTGGSKLRWYLDPMGAIIIALGVIISWGRTIYSEFELLAGKSAPHDFLQLLIYKCATFTDSIEKVDTVRAYHASGIQKNLYMPLPHTNQSSSTQSGPDYFVEVDIVMDENTPLWKAHDVSQQLQDKIEVLPNVERAFVHVDHEWTHVPEHRKAAKSPV
ncbi:Metal tolerance protein 9 [Psilocybe cubensis]|uniref:Metal tolerance protein 9 n=1 Tax=Psilocybe cubensis TaxID=181762 RepID=A0ACB8HGY6_PSICU|nr:Metal tolerance protein 9 [Psilocybe cubensis]KAH9486424.1 Metal tolerance protein 9 [Psilocybe cubensis]